MASPIYEYSALSEGYFRLLTIISIDENEQVTCKLEDFLLDMAPEYMTLSYAWGNPLASSMIICNEKSLAITPHLHGAFYHLHALDSATKVWIDAVCINQADDAEKAVQTQRMNNVYRSAQKMMVWLGEGDNDSDNALSRIEDINKSLALILQDSTPENITFIEEWLRNDDLSLSDLPNIGDPVWPAFGQILSKPWFTRLWVLQEVVLAKEIVVAYGRKQIEWDNLATLALGLRRAVLIDFIGGTPSIASKVKRSVGAISLVPIAKELAQSKHTGLLALMRIGREKDCTEPLDRIYGLLGLPDPAVASRIVVNYSTESKRMWWIAYIQHGKIELQVDTSLTLLSLAVSQQKPIELPSWCPNWNSPAKDAIPFTGTAYQAGFESPSDRLRPNFRDVENSNNIQILGFRIDCVREVVGSSKHCFDAEIAHEPSEFYSLMSEYESRCLKVSQDTYHQPNEIPDAHWRTLAADADNQSRSPLPANMLESYLLCKRLWKLKRDQISPSPIDSMSGSERQATLNYRQLLEVKRTRTFFSTHGGRVGLGPCDLQAGDVICVLYGGAPLFVLRFNGSSKVAQLVGDTFVYGLMDLNTTPVSDREDEWFTIG